MYQKNFDAWIFQKKKVDQEIIAIKNRLHIGEVRWCSIGVNIGSEIDGKGEGFFRPVLIVSLVGSALCLVVPVTSKIKREVPGFFVVTINNQEQSLCIQHMRSVSQKRIYQRMVTISENKLQSVKEKIKEFYNF
jgi:mRNA interferase MazF